MVFINLEVDTPNTEVQERDLKTRDHWVKRDPRLIRLTGTHPLNCQPPLTLMYDQGFITPHQLHFVRSHGHVAETSDEDVANWTIKIEGLVKNPYEISLKELKEKSDVITLPVTLCCAGNRRGEQNMVRMSKGFTWGASGVSTSFWTGCLLRDVLKVAQPERRAKWVVFEGLEDLPNGKYATGVVTQWAMSFDKAIMIAWKQNGMDLSPDHGRPVRIIIPGVIGGRSVKYLTKITLQEETPSGWYHKYDNRVLPTTVTPEESAKDDKWWCDERYALNNLNIQSVTVKPEHGMTMSKTAEGNFKVEGFGYNGSGVKIGKVEISLDKGATWTEANIHYLEDKLRDMVEDDGLTELYGGKVDMCDRYLYFAWSFWDVEIPCQDIVKAKDIVVRAMDVDMNIQPRDMYWNVLGMSGNWWYRVAIVDEGDHVKFEHPVNVPTKDGWMDRVVASGRNPAEINWGEPLEGQGQTIVPPPVPKKEIKMTRDDMESVIITKKQLEDMSKTRSVFTIKGAVYDGTDFLDKHPGGADSIKMVAGTDATDDFMAIHSENAKHMLVKYHIGMLEKDEKDDSAPVVAEAPGPTFLDPKKWKKVELIERSDVSHDTRLFKLKLQTPEQTSGLPVGQHIFIRAKDPATGNYVVRAYTPVSSHTTQGYLELLIKIYFPRGNIPGGKLGMIMENSPVGTEFEVKGPIGGFRYLGNGECEVAGQKVHSNMFYMVCGGSGITPCYQVLKEMVHDTDSTIKSYLMYGNKEIKDILLKPEIEKFESESHNRITADYWLDVKPTDPNTNLDQFKFGFITKECLSSLASTEDLKKSMFLTCGPKPLVEIVRTWADEIGIDQSHVVIF